MREADNQRLLTLVLPHLQKQFGRPVDEAAQARLLAGMDGLKQRAKTMIELAESASFYVSRPSFPLSNGKAQRLLEGDGPARSEEHTSELQSLMRISYAVFCLKKKKII